MASENRDTSKEQTGDDDLDELLEMASENRDTSKEQTGDDDLDELLDSAIADFDKPTENEKNNCPVSTDSEDASGAQAAEPWDTEFLLEAQKQLDENMKALFEGGGDGSLPLSPEEFGSQLQKLAEVANKVFTENPIDPDFSATIAQSLRTLSDDAGNLQPQLDPEALSSMLGDLNMGGSEGGANELTNFMHTMMQSFLSKDLLYPSLKEICTKFPGWLEENKESISSTEYDNYSKQFKLMEGICTEFEAESDTDPEDTKKQRFTRVLKLLEEMQKLGQPPKDLVGENTLLDGNAMPFQMPNNDPSQCCLM
uniref:Peroxin-19 n=2 Tax=Lygus hesperus TaxID=30085 RepID=A0A146LGQ8_LYGHE